MRMSGVRILRCIEKVNTLHVGIFGPGLSGKTTLAKRLSRVYWETKGTKSIVLDPIGDSWGRHAFVTRDREKFLWMLGHERQCAVFIEESSETVDRDRTMVHMFTSIRHKGHRTHVIGHTGASLLPVMREQLQTLYLFRQPRSAAEIWSELLSEPEILQACRLKQFEFLFCRLYHRPQIMILKK